MRSSFRLEGQQEMEQSLLAGRLLLAIWDAAVVVVTRLMGDAWGCVGGLYCGGV